MKKLINSMLDRQRTGQVLVLFAMMLVVIILFVGLAIDLGFAYLTKASLSKSVDSACLMGVRALSQGDDKAKEIAGNAFKANYGVSGRDKTAPTPQVDVLTDASTGNRSVEVKASSVINTFFLRVIPSFSTLTVSANAAAIRTKVIMSLVLDRSGSTRPKRDGGNGASVALPDAVSNFIEQFDDNTDRAAVVSFAYHARTDLTMRQPFKSAVKAAFPLGADGYTGSEPGINKGKDQIDSVTVKPGEEVLKVLVFFTDGLANTWQYSFNCGGQNLKRNITPYDGPGTHQLYDPDTGNWVSGCTLPATIPSIDPDPSIPPIRPLNWCDVRDEGERRAEAAASKVRAEGIVIYCIGLGDPSVSEGAGAGCPKPSLNTNFMIRVANQRLSNPKFKSDEPEGEALFVPDETQLADVFDTLAKKILTRLSQ